MRDLNDDILIQTPKSLDDLLDQSISAAPIPLLDEVEATSPEMIEPQTVATSEVTEAITAIDLNYEAETADSHKTILLPNHSQAQFKLINFDSAQSTRTLNQSTMLIGRSHEAQLPIMHPSVSSQHAKVELKDGHHTIIDLNSTNGTRVNGELIAQCLLRCHDIIEFGDVRCEYLTRSAKPIAHSPQVIEVLEDLEFKRVTRRPMLGKWLKRYQRPLSLTFALALALYWAANKPAHQARLAPEQMVRAAFSLAGDSPIQLSENERIAKHQLQLAQQLLVNKKYQEAELKTTLILEKIDPNNLEATLLASEIKKLIALDNDRLAQARELSEDALARLKHLMSLAGSAADQRRYDDAKMLYRQILAIDPLHEVAKENLQNIEQKLAVDSQNAAKIGSLQASLSESYTQGMIAYNASNFNQAAYHLRPLLEYKQFRYYREVRNTMNDVTEKLKVDIEEKLSEANNQMNSGRLLAAKQIVDDILLGTPNHKATTTLKNQLIHASREQARALYREGYTFEHLVQDYTAAKERYQKVIELLPDRAEEYNQKAETRLKQLN